MSNPDFEAVLHHPVRRAGDRNRESAQPARPGEAERRQLTVLFCDVVDSTELYSRFDAEDVREAINRFLTTCSAIVAAHSGFVARYMGDGVLVYFGYPQAMEDSAERAVRAGFELLRAAADLKAPDGQPLRIRVGAATGLSVVGDLIGSGASSEIAIVGNTPNVAARILATAPPDALMIADSTHRMIGAVFVCEDAGLRHYRGIDEPIRVWRVLREGPDDARYEERRLTDSPFFGRDDELAQLHGCWQRAVDGQGQLAIVLGEPGIGKSTLLRRFESMLEGQDYGRIVVQCTARHGDSPLYPLIAYLKRAVRIDGSEADEVRLARIEQFLGARSTPTEIGLLASLLSIPYESRHPPPALTPAMQKAMTLDLVASRAIDIAADRPLLIIAEDVHWMDPTTFELFERVVARFTTKAVLMVATGRYEHPSIAAWATNSHPIHLAPLPRDAVERIVQRIVQASDLSAVFVEQIIAKSEGIPLFAEELAKATVEAHAVAAERPAPTTPRSSELEVPLTLRDGLMARLDRLGRAKEIAQIGAAIGRKFAMPILQAVHPGRAGTLQQDLDRLVAAELVVVLMNGTQIEYAFKHALVQEAAYESLLRARRRALHCQIAQAIESSTPELADSEPETLAHHWSRGDRPAEAAGYWLRAGQRAVSRAANVEAIRHLATGIALLPRLAGNARLGEMDFKLHLALGQACYVVDGPAAPTTTAAYQRAQELVGEIADAEQRYLVLYGIFSGYHFASKFELAREPAQRFLELATRDSSDAHLCQAHRMLGYLGFFRADAPESLRHFHALAGRYRPELHAQMATRYGADCLVASRAFQQLIDCIQGRIDASTAMARDNLAYALELGHPASIGWAYASCAYLHYWLQDPTTTQAIADEGLRFCLANNVGSWELHCRAFTLWATMRLDRSRNVTIPLEETLSAVQHGNALGLPLLRALLVEVLVDGGRAQQGLQTIDVAIDEMQKSSQLFFEPTVHHVRSTALRALGRDADAEAALRHSMQAASRLSGALLELRALIALVGPNGRPTGDERTRMTTLCAALETTSSCADLDAARRILATA